MKKILSCAMVLALFLSLSLTGGWGVPAEADDSEDPVGAYEMTVMLLEGIPYTERQNTWSSFRLQVKEDGTAELTTPDGVRSFLWDEENFTGEDGILVPYSYHDGTLILNDNDFIMTFQKMEGVVGLWIAMVNVGGLLGEETEVADSLKNVNCDLVLDLRSDMSCIVSIDSESMLPSLRQAVKEVFVASLEANGSSAEAAEDLYGKSLDEIVDGVIASMDLSALNETQTGTYMVRDGEISLRLDSGAHPGTWDSSSMTLQLASYGQVRFTHVSGEDILAKGEGVMRYAEFAAAEADAPVTVECYVQACQDWWEDSVSVYAQDAEGGYFLYNMACTEDDAKLLLPGQKIRVTGYKAEWSGETEIIDARFEIIKGSFLFRAADVTGLLGKDELIDYQNRKVSFKGLTVEAYDESGAAFAYKDPDGKTDDLYFKASRDGVSYEFCVEFYLCGQDTQVYKTVEGLRVGDTVDLEGFLYWYNGANPHITSVTVK